MRTNTNTTSAVECAVRTNIALISIITKQDKRMKEIMKPARLLLLSAFLLFFALPGPAMAADWNPLPDTGQTKCYDVAGTEITCPAVGQPLHGQDAQYHGPTPSHTNNGSTVLDNNTNLTWQQNTADTNDDGSITSADQIAWQDAVDYCDTLSFAGSADWRLPSFTELDSIVDYGRYNPAINPVFLCESSYYWSATTVADYTDAAWGVNFYNGNEYSSIKTFHAYVRCVRGGL